MNEAKLTLNEQGQGIFYISDGKEWLGKLEVTVSANQLIAHHTSVSPAAEGKGIGKKLVADMVAYAREHQLKITTECTFVHAQFKRNEQEYGDVWEKGER